MIRLTELKLPVQLVTDEHKEIELLYQLLKDKYSELKNQMCLNLIYLKKQLMPEKKSQVLYVYSVDLVCRDELKILDRQYPNCSVQEIVNFEPEITGKLKLKYRPVVIGFGPSGIFAAFIVGKTWV